MRRVLPYANMYYIIFSISRCKIYAVYTLLKRFFSLLN